MIIKDFFFPKFKDNSRTNCTFLEFNEFSRTKIIFKDFSRSVRTLLNANLYTKFEDSILNGCGDIFDEILERQKKEQK